MDSCPVCRSGLVKFIEICTPDYSFNAKDKDSIETRAECQECLHLWNPNPFNCDYGSEDFLFFSDGGGARFSDQCQFIENVLVRASAVLDVGCSDGELGSFVKKEYGVPNYHGIELSTAGQMARNNIDLVYSKPLATLLDKKIVSENYYDCLIYSHVLEHIDNIRRELESAHKCLKSEGVLFVEIPNESGTRNLPYDFNPAHLHYFSVNSISKLLEQTGFRIDKIDNYSWMNEYRNQCIRVSAKKSQLLTKHHNLLEDTLSELSESDIILWGCGGLSKRVVQYYLNTDKIKLCVDSNEKFQGISFMGLTVLPPSSIDKYRNYTILVASIDFYQEIVEEIHNKHPNHTGKIVGLGELLTRHARH